MYNISLSILYKAIEEIERNATNRGDKTAMCSSNIDTILDHGLPEYSWCLKCGTKVYDEIKIVIEREFCKLSMRWR